MITDRTARFVWNIFKPVVFKAFITGFTIQSVQVYDEKCKLPKTHFPDQGRPPEAFSFGELHVCACISFPVESSEQLAPLYYTVASSNIF